MMQLSIASIHDIPDLVALLSILFSQEQEFTPNAQAQTSALSDIINNPTLGHILVARINSKPVGMVNILYTCSTALGGKVCLLEDMVIAPDARSQQLGSQLLGYAIKHAKQAGCKRITLLTDTSNINAQHFYQRFGFTASGMMPMRLLLADRNTIHNN